MSLPSHKRSSPASRLGFSLIEIISVFAILAILAGIILMVTPGLREGARESRAKADMHVIQQALEAYKGKFGDYPVVPDGATLITLGISRDAYLLNALSGLIGPELTDLTAGGGSGVKSMLNHSLLVFDKVQLPYGSLVDNWMVDPWGGAYDYQYDPATSFGYSLSSKGPDGTAGNADDVIAK